jgi:hypothetical protein
MVDVRGTITPIISLNDRIREQLVQDSSIISEKTRIIESQASRLLEYDELIEELKRKL